MVSTPYPLPRSARRTPYLQGNGGTVYGPYGDGWGIFDVEDVAVWTKSGAQTEFILRLDATVAKTDPAAAYSSFTVTFPAAISSAVQFYAEGRRVAEREVAITRGGAIASDALEKELSKDSVVSQEVRRDLDALSEELKALRARVTAGELVDLQGAYPGLSPAAFGATGYPTPAAAAAGVNSTAELQEWLDYMAAHTGFRGWLPAFYKCTAGLAVTTALPLSIAAAGSRQGGLVFDIGAGERAIDIAFPDYGVGGVLDLRNFSILYAGDAVAGDALRARTLDADAPLGGSFKGSVIQDLWIDDIRGVATGWWGNGIVLEQMPQTKIHDNWIGGRSGLTTEKTGSGILIGTWCNGTNITKNRIRGFASGIAVGVTPANDATFQYEGVTIDDNKIQGCDVGVHQPFITPEVASIITKNQFDTASFGIDIPNVVQYQIQGNRFNHSGRIKSHVDIRLRATDADGVTPLVRRVSHLISDNLTSRTSYANIVLGITNASPGVLSFDGDNIYEDGQRVFIHGSRSMGMTEVREKVFTVADLDTDAKTFALKTEDGTAYVDTTGYGTYVVNPPAQNITDLQLTSPLRVTYAGTDITFRDDEVVISGITDGPLELNGLQLRVADVDWANNYVWLEIDLDEFPDGLDPWVAGGKIQIVGTATVKPLSTFLELDAADYCTVADNKIMNRDVGVRRSSEVTQVFMSGNELLRCKLPMVDRDYNEVRFNQSLDVYIDDNNTKGDGIFDDTANLRRVLREGRDLILSPLKTYRISSRLDLEFDNQRIAGNNALILMDTAAGAFDNEDETEGARYGTDACGIYGEGLDNVHIVNVRIKPTAYVDDRYVKAIALAGCTNIRVDGNEAFGFSRAKGIIAIMGCQGGSVSGNHIHSSSTSTTTGVNVDAQVTGIQFDGDLAAEAPDDSADIIVSGNRIHDLTCGAATIAALGYQTDGINITSNGTGLQVTNNLITNVGEGIDTFANDALIQGNRISGCYYYGIKLAHGASRNAVVDNDISDCGIFGVNIASSSTADEHLMDNLIARNSIRSINPDSVFTSTSTGGIRISNNNADTKFVRGTIIKDNDIRPGANSAYGIHVRSTVVSGAAADATLRRNAIADAATQDILIDDEADVTVFERDEASTGFEMLLDNADMSGAASYVVDATVLKRPWRRIEIDINDLEHDTGSAAFTIELSDDDGATWAAALQITPSIATGIQMDGTITIKKADIASGNRLLRSVMGQTNTGSNTWRRTQNVNLTAGYVNAIRITNGGGLNLIGGRLTLEVWL